jgi:hypothetical protein
VASISKNPQILGVAVPNLVPRGLCTSNLKYTSPIAKTDKPFSPFDLFCARNFPPCPVSCVGHERVDARQYTPNPMLCFRCQVWPHPATTYVYTEHCGLCGQSGHGETPCPRHLSVSTAVTTADPFF